MKRKVSNRLIPSARELVIAMISIPVGYCFNFIKTDSWHTVAFISILLICAVILIVCLELIGFQDVRVKIESGNKAFDTCKKTVQKAKFDITIVGPHFIQEDQITTEEHDDYLTEGVEAVINRHIHEVTDDSEIFTYFRILQLADPGVVDSGDGSISKSAIHNKGMADHLERMLKERKDHRVNIQVKARTVINSFPSVLVVDDGWVFLSLPRYHNKKGHYSYDFVIGIEDKSGRFPTIMKKIIMNFAVDDREITSIR